MPSNGYCANCGFNNISAGARSWTERRKGKQLLGCFLLMGGCGLMIAAALYALAVGFLSACMAFGNGSQQHQDWPPPAAVLAMILGGIIAVSAIVLWIADYLSARTR